MSVAVEDLTRVRVQDPGAIARAAAERVRPDGLLGDHGGLLMVAADHTARAAMTAGGRSMADRRELLRRLARVLADPAVNGVMATPDVLDDLLLMGVLDRKVVVGSMNRGGLVGAAFEFDDRLTAYSAAAIEAARFEGGKMLNRVAMDDPGTVAMLETTGRVVSDLASRGLMAMLEPFMSSRGADGKVGNDLTADAVATSCAVCAALGDTSAHTWLKVPWVEDLERGLAATTLPCVLLGGEVNQDAEATYARWGAALAIPNVYGMVLGRGLLFPADDDVDAAVAAVAGLMAAVTA